MYGFTQSTALLRGGGCVLSFVCAQGIAEESQNQKMRNAEISRKEANRGELFNVSACRNKKRFRASQDNKSELG